ncbi:MAG: methyl-accepting chemotaxis protein [bacterium]
MQVSVKIKIFGALVFGYVLVLVASLYHSSTNQKIQMEALMKDRGHESALSYFDALNTMMLTGTMQQRELLQKKVQGRDQVIDARVVRGELVSKVFGPGMSSEKSEDKFDRKALKGAFVNEIVQGENGRVLEVAYPLVASKNFHETDCLSCHQVAEGSILGAIRISYDLTQLDQQVNEAVMKSALIQLLIIAIGLVITIFTVQLSVVKPAYILEKEVSRIGESLDLTGHVSLKRDDEFGRIAKASNQMFDAFANGLRQTRSVAEQVTRSVGQLLALSSSTRDQIDSQSQSVDKISDHMVRLEGSAKQIRTLAENTAVDANQAEQKAVDSVGQAQNAVTGIKHLFQLVESAEGKVSNLNVRTDKMAGILDMIRNIADQTNLLALNAAIEAARAGESGRGFAVVADEVRTLAGRTQESTQEIEESIRDLQNDVHVVVNDMSEAKKVANKGVLQVDSTVSGLSEISSVISQIAGSTRGVSDLSKEQEKMSTAVKSESLRIDESINHVDNMANDLVELAANQKGLAGELTSTVSQFKV